MLPKMPNLSAPKSINGNQINKKAASQYKIGDGL
jgi:hypothetical protein